VIKVRKISTVQPPWIANHDWVDAVTATRDTILAALFTGEGARTQRGLPSIDLVGSYDRGMRAFRYKRGWKIKVCPLASRWDFCAVHHGSRLEGRRIRMSWVRSLFKRPGEYFTWQETEKLMSEFLEGPSNPPSASWVELAWR